MNAAIQPGTISDMKADAPPFTRKLARALEGKTARQVAEDAGLSSEQAIYDYLSKQTIPRSATCLRLAKALNVSLEWLVDDTQSVDDPSHLGSNLTDYDLMLELGRRHVSLAKEAKLCIEQFLKIDWKSEAEFVFSQADSDGLTMGVDVRPTFPIGRPQKIVKGSGFQLASHLNGHESPFAKMDYFNLSRFIWMHAEKLGITSEQATDYSLDKLREKLSDASMQNPMNRWVYLHQYIMTTIGFFGDNIKEVYQAVSRKALEKIAQGKLPTGDTTSPTFYEDFLRS